MKSCSVILCAITLLALSCGQTHKVCQVCHRDECKGLAFRIVLNYITYAMTH